MKAILGINGHFEHPSAAIIIDGKLAFAMEEERLTRIKHGKSYSPYKSYIPFQSIYEGLRTCGIHASDISEIAYSYSSELHLQSLKGCMTGDRRSSLKEEISAFRAARNIRHALKGPYEIPRRHGKHLPDRAFENTLFTEWDHHLSHAASAFYLSGFDESLVVVSDGSGENACTSVYLGKGSQLQKVASVDLPHSLGFFYSDMTDRLGFEPFSDEYKVMGLAAYGVDAYGSEMKQILSMENDGTYRYQPHLIDQLAHIPRRTYNGPLEQVHQDLAKSVQVRLEEILIHIVSHHMKAQGQKNLSLAGGTFLNVLANAKLAALPSVENIFVQPGAHDAGTAIGAAALSWIATGGNPQIEFESMFLGTAATEEDIESALRLGQIPYQKINAGDMPLRLAEILADENVVALYRGRMEFGPRSLGNRSLLASPRSARTREKLNILKDREMFRPLAPLVAEESFSKYFDGIPNRYMMLTSEVKPWARKEIPAVTHADNTARVQVVAKAHDPFLHEVLTQFHHKTDIPVLVNTSFNVRGKPIDATPQDALSSFFTAGIDYLVMESYLIKNPITQDKRVA